MKKEIIKIEDIDAAYKSEKAKIALGIGQPKKVIQLGTVILDRVTRDKKKGYKIGGVLINKDSGWRDRYEDVLDDVWVKRSGEDLEKGLIEVMFIKDIWSEERIMFSVYIDTSGYKESMTNISKLIVGEPTSIDAGSFMALEANIEFDSKQYDSLPVATKREYLYRSMMIKNSHEKILSHISEIEYPYTLPKSYSSYHNYSTINNDNFFNFLEFISKDEKLMALFAMCPIGYDIGEIIKNASSQALKYLHFLPVPILRWIEWDLLTKEEAEFALGKIKERKYNYINNFQDYKRIMPKIINKLTKIIKGGKYEKPE